MKKLLLFFLVFFLILLPLSAQTTKKIGQLESQRSALHKKISNSEKLLLSTKKDVKSQLSNLVVLNGQIKEREKYVDFLHENIKSLSSDIVTHKNELEELKKNLQDKKEKYARSVKYMRKNRSIEEKLMFIFSAKNLTQMYRRMRYVKEYANYQRLQGKEIEARSRQILHKKNELENTMATKTHFLKQGEQEKANLEIKHQERQKVIDNLNKKQKGLQAEINKNRQTAQKLDAQIDRLIAIEVEKARKRALEEARKRAEEERRRIAAEEEKARLARARAKAENKENNKTSDVASEKAVAKTEHKTYKPVEEYNINNADKVLSGNFVHNKGRMPMPVTGPYVVVGHYGTYNVSGLQNVSLDNKGIDIKARNGAQARSIFNGEVSAIFSYNGLVNILVRHGEYISVYCNLTSASVAKGSKVSTGQSLGPIHIDETGNAILHFQLRKETAKLNPEQWLRR